MKTLYPVKTIVDGNRCFEIPLTEIAAQVPMGGALKILSPKKYISAQQIKWWKGVLLPALEKDAGFTELWWENHLKLNVMPVEFAPKSYEYGGETFVYIPSITILSVKKMNLLIVGSVDYLRGKEDDPDDNGKGFSWVTLPDVSLRKDKEVKDE